MQKKNFMYKVTIPVYFKESDLKIRDVYSCSMSGNEDWSCIWTFYSTTCLLL